ncbi:uncharacterized protein PSFLO_06336 [Pseudozyma flocculosa]|nr:uncharacterized protein PSFLO_06336 [Pseudozyma flocculosa]
MPRSRPPNLSIRTRALPAASLLLPLFCFLLLCFGPISLVSAGPSPSPAPSPVPAPTPTPAPSPIPARHLDDERLNQIHAAESPDLSSMPHWVDINVSPPLTCQPMNITFDPRRGAPPFQVMVTIEDWWPYTVSLGATYDAIDKQLWMYQFDVPTFRGATTHPNLIVTITDSTGLMSNSSAFMQVADGPDTNCASYGGGTDFIFYTERSPSQCSDFDIFWRGAYAEPLSIIMLPESTAPLNVPVTNASSGKLTWQMAMHGGSRFMMTMGDTGPHGNGGVSRVNIVGLNEYASDSCLGMASSYGRDLLVPVSTISSATVFPDATSTLRSVLTTNGQVSTVTIRETVRNGRRVESNSSSPAGLVGGLVAIGVAIGLGSAFIIWCICRRRARRSGVKTWDLPSDPSMPFNINTSMPIAPGLFGGGKRRGSAGQHQRQHQHQPLDGEDNGDSLRTPQSPTGSNIFRDPAPTSGSRGQANGVSRRGSLRSWTSNAFESVGLRPVGGGDGRNGSSADAYALTQTFSSPSASAAQSRSGTPAYANEGFRPQLQLRRGSMGLGNDGSPVDGSVGPFSAFRDDPSSPEGADTWRSGGVRSQFGSNGGSLPSEDDIASPLDRSPWPNHQSYSPGVAAGVARDGTVKSVSGRVGAGRTHRSDFASGDAGDGYEDLITPVRGVFGEGDDFLQQQQQHRHLGQGTANSRTWRSYQTASSGSYSSGRFHLSSNPFDDSNDVSVPMRRDASSASAYRRGDGSSGGNSRTGTTRIIHHADAGLLLDDTADGDGEGEYPEQIMELPPQYETITRVSPSSPTSHQQPSPARGWMQSDSGTFAPAADGGRAHPSDGVASAASARADGTSSAAAPASVQEDEDEDEFWTGPAAAHAPAGVNGGRAA